MSLLKSAVLSVQTLLVFFALYTFRLLVFGEGAFVEPWEGIIAKSPYLGAIIFLVIYFLRHISAEKQRDREEKAAEREAREKQTEEYKKALEDLSNTYKESMTRSDLIHQDVIRTNAKLETTLNRLNPA